MPPPVLLPSCLDVMRDWVERLAHRAVWSGLEAGRLAAEFIPRRLLLFFSRALAGMGFYLCLGFRKRSIENLTLALGDRLTRAETATVVRRILRNFVLDLIEIGHALSVSPGELRREIPMVGREHLEAAMARGRGTIILSAHLGNFFLLGTRLAVEGYPAYVLVNPPRGRALREVLDHYRLRIGQRTIQARPRKQASRELIQVLRDNQIAIVIADEYRSGSGVYAPFFGGTVLARRGPATLALRTGAAVVPAYLVRGPDHRLTLVVEPEMEILKSGEVRSDVKENTMRITGWLERVVRVYPDQWNWMNIRWQRASLEALVGEEKRYEGFA